MLTIREHSLYLVLSEEYGAGRPVEYIAREAVAGGIDILQMREKRKPREELERLGQTLHDLCRAGGVLFIINDDPVLAAELNAGGVHLGQEDMVGHPAASVRRFLGRDKIIGVSTHSVAQFRQADELDVDYIAFGPVFPTLTKDYTIGPQDIGTVLKMTAKPVVVIGGINTSNVDILLKEGARHVALIRDIMQAEDIAGRVRWYKARLAGRGGKT